MVPSAPGIAEGVSMSMASKAAKVKDISIMLRSTSRGRCANGAKDTKKYAVDGIPRKACDITTSTAKCGICAKGVAMDRRGAALAVALATRWLWGKNGESYVMRLEVLGA